MTKKIIDSQDRDLFRQTVGNVQAVKSDKVHLKPDAAPKPYPKPKSNNPNETLPDLFDSDIDHVGREESLNYTAPGLQHNILAKLRNGFFGVQAELDLHGYISDAAKLQVITFLSRNKAAGHRCVHIIHGKGRRSNDDYPVLKNKLNRWLRQHPDVQAFCSAPQRQGGTGAVYVLLKVSRDFSQHFEEKFD